MTTSERPRPYNAHFRTGAVYDDLDPTAHETYTDEADRHHSYSPADHAWISFHLTLDLERSRGPA